MVVKKVFHSAEMWVVWTVSKKERMTAALLVEKKATKLADKSA